MPHTVSLYDKHEHSMNSIKRQQRFISKYALPLVVVNTHVPTELAQRPYVNSIYESAMQAVEEQLAKLANIILDHEIVQDKLGVEATLVVKGSTATELKKAMAYIENNHTLGRLMNIDIISPQGRAISRKENQMEARRCVICDGAASYCATHHRHSIADLDAHISHLVEDHLATEVAA